MGRGRFGDRGHRHRYGPETVTAEVAALIEMIDAFVSGEDRSLLLADRMQELIMLAFFGDARFDEPLAALAQYEPLEGPEFYDARMVIDELVPLRAHLVADEDSEDR